MEVHEVSNNQNVFLCFVSCSFADATWLQGLFAQMVRFKVHPNVICYNVAIGAYAKGGQWREAVRLLNTMKDSTILPNNISY